MGAKWSSRCHSYNDEWCISDWGACCAGFKGRWVKKDDDDDDDDDDDVDDDDDQGWGDGDGDDEDNDDNNELSMDCPLFLLHPSSDSERVGTKNASYFVSSCGLRPYSLAARLLSCVLHR